MRTTRVLAIATAVVLAAPLLRAESGRTILGAGDGVRTILDFSSRGHFAPGPKVVTSVVTSTLSEAVGWGFEREEEGWIQVIADPARAAWRTRTVSGPLRDEGGVVNFADAPDLLMLLAPQAFVGNARTGALGHTVRGPLSLERRARPRLPELVSSCGEVPRVLLSGDPAHDAAVVASDGVEIVGVTSSVRRVPGGWEYTWRARNGTAQDLAFDWPGAPAQNDFGWSILLAAGTEEVVTRTSPLPPRVVYGPVSWSRLADDVPVFHTAGEAYRPAE